MPKFAPAPQMPQKSSGFSSALAFTSSPSAVTTSTDELVDGEAVLAHDPADAAAERQAGDAGVRDDAGRHREAERLRLAVELAEQDACLDPRRARLGIDTDALHGREVDHNASSAIDSPGKLWPPLRTATGRPVVRPNLTAEMTSATPAQRAISAGGRSIEPFQILRCSS